MSQFPSCLREGRTLGLLIASCLFQAGCADPLLELTTQLDDSDVKVRRQAARRIGEMGEEAVSTHAAVSRRLKDSDVEIRRLAAFALGRMGPAAIDEVPQLKVALEDQDRSVRFSAAYALTQIVPQDDACIAVLGEGIRANELRAIVVVGKLGKTAKQAVPDLTSALRSRIPLVRQKAAESLGQIGADAKPAVRFLRTASRDPDSEVRAAVAEALQAILAE